LPHDGVAGVTRYALYFAPPAGSPWWQVGCQWLGRDPATGRELVQPAIPGLPHPWLPKLTNDARRYGLHATLKAPFRLAYGFTETHLLQMAQTFCSLQRRVPVGPLGVDRLGASLVLCRGDETEEIDALAMRCVSYFDVLRAAPTAEERIKYRARNLSERQQVLLRRWGYPYTEDQFRFHLTLTDSLATVPADVADKLRNGAQAHFAGAQAIDPLVIDGLTIFREDRPGSPFIVWQRIPFSAGETRQGLSVWQGAGNTAMEEPHQASKQ
jgi:hypothetical protein